MVSPVCAIGVIVFVCVVLRINKKSLINFANLSGNTKERIFIEIQK